MELLGPSLENLFQMLNKKFSLKTACMLGIQMIDRIEYLHSRKLIHRDIKPDNFVIGRGNNSHTVYILDFGLAKKYWSTRQNRHLPFCTNKKLTGTARYASINALSGCEQGRRDDLESIGYIIMYFLRGSLPWQGLKVNNIDDRYKKICDKKKATSAKELCNGFPKELELFVKYTRNLGFMDVPDYEYLRNLLKSVIEHEHKVIDFHYDWLQKKPNIRPDDLIYTNDYNIKYDGDNVWLNRKYCNGHNANPNLYKSKNYYINKNNLIHDNFRPKPIKYDNNHIDEEKNDGYSHQQSNKDNNSLVPQTLNSNIFS